jgi:excisionase family DNA binding protein
MPDDFTPIDWLTTAEAAELTGYTDAHIRLLINRGRLPAVKRGGAWFLRRQDVMAYAEEMKRLGPAKHDPWRTGARRREGE